MSFRSTLPYLLRGVKVVRPNQVWSTDITYVRLARGFAYLVAITANQPFSGWDHVFAEPAMTLATVDRLVHHSNIFELNVESFRRRFAQQGLAPAEQKPQTVEKEEEAK